MTTTRTSNTKAGDLIADRVAFTGNNLYGVLGSLTGSVIYDTGRLPDEYEQQLRLDQPSYIVYSYGTPIAWYCDKGWFIPDAKYSTTTSKHQNYVRRAIA
jgi:hypothetical protein